MKEMFYRIERTKGEILDKGVIEGFRYYIVSYGTHPCCYIILPKTHRYYKKDYIDIDLNAHGGLTYADTELFCHAHSINQEWIIGWDYAHYGDFMGYYLLEGFECFRLGHKYTTKALYEDVKFAIKQLKEVSNAG